MSTTNEAAHDKLRQTTTARPSEGDQARTIYVPRASLPGFPKGGKVRTLLRSVAVLDGWLEENEGTTDDEVRLRRMKRWRAEALEQLRLELNRARS